VGGTVERVHDKYEYPANRNLVEYFKVLGYDLGHPLAPDRANPIFFTNAVMGLKNGSMSSNFSDRWLEESRREFLIPLLDVIKPKIIITIGAKPTVTIGKIYSFPVGSQTHMVNAAPIRTIAGPMVFPVFHTGGLGLVNRPKAQQLEDWRRIKTWL
jgi:uracil-DNA glycosylase